MILAEKIMSLRKKAGWSQEELAEQLEVSRQSVSKWESAISIPDIEKIIKMSQIFNVSTDYLLKDSDDDEDIAEGKKSVDAVSTEVDSDSNSNVRQISMEFASEFMDTSKEVSKKIALGVFMCIVSPIVLILLSGMSEAPYEYLSENLAAGIGMCVLLVVIALAVLIFVLEGMKLKKFEFLEKEEIRLMYGVESAVNRRKEAYESTFRMSVAIGVALCIVGVIPTIIAGAMEAGDMVLLVSVCDLLLLVAIAVFMFVSTGVVYGSYQKLLQEEEYEVEKKKSNKKYGNIWAIYWCLVTAGFLAWSFMQNAWDISWVVWPIAGILFVPFKFIIEGIGNKSK